MSLDIKSLKCSGSLSQQSPRSKSLTVAGCLSHQTPRSLSRQTPRSLARDLLVASNSLLPGPPRNRTLGSAGKQVFHYDAESGSMVQSSDIRKVSRLRCGKPKLWWTLLGIFLLVISVLFAALLAVWYWSINKAVKEMNHNSQTALNKYARVTFKSIDQLADDLDLKDMHAARLAIEEYLNVPFLAVELLGTGMKERHGNIKVDDMEASVKYLWNIYSTLPRINTRDIKQPMLEGIFYADYKGTYVSYINQCSRANSPYCLAEAEDRFSYGMDFRPPDGHFSPEEDCPTSCPKAGNISDDSVNFYKVDKVSGKPTLLLGQQKYDPRGRPWFDAAVKANGISAWSSVYADLLYEDGGHPDIGFSVAQAHFVDSRPQMVAGATLTLAHMTEILKQQDSDKRSFLFVVEMHTGKMVASSQGFEYVICKRPGCAKNKQLLWNETGCPKTRLAVSSLLDKYTSLDNLTASDMIQCSQTAHWYSYDILRNGKGAFALNWVLVHVQPADTYKGKIVEDLSNHEEALQQSVRDVEKAMRHSMVLTGGVCLVFVIVGSLALGAISHLVTKPLKLIVKDMQSVARLEFDKIDRILRTDTRSSSASGTPCSGGLSVGCKIREVAEIRETFASMTKGLRSFSRYMDPYVVQVLIQSKQQAQLGVAKAEATIFFSDIAGFTGIAETIEPPMLMELLSEYLETMSGIIMKHSGVVGEFIGDAIMAWWNVPWEFEDNSHTLAALVAALEQQQRLGELRQKWCKKGLPEVRARMGLARGSVLAGNIGSHNRMKYGLVGDSVNLASRLENLCKRYKVQTLVDDEVRNAPGVETRFLLRPIDLVTVKGRSSTTELYEVVACRAQVRGTSLQDMYDKFCTDFVAVHKLFRARDFHGALQAVNEYLKLWPSDGPAQILKSRCEDLLANPPCEGWSPVENLTEK